MGNALFTRRPRTREVISLQVVGCSGRYHLDMYKIADSQDLPNYRAADQGRWLEDDGGRQADCRVVWKQESSVRGGHCENHDHALLFLMGESPPI
jgi:hypothetical protein